MIHTLDLQFLDHADTIAAFLVETSGGLVLVEAGPNSTFPALQQAVAAKGFKLEDVKNVFLSHIHFDHAGAAWCLADLGATIHVHPAGYKHLAEPSKLYNSAKMIYGDQMERLWGEMRPIKEENLNAVENGQKIAVGDSVFKAHHTPGHAVHHIAWQLDEDVVFTGDVAGICIDGGPVVAPCPPPDINIEHWQNSINLLRHLPAQKMYLTHFGLVSNKQAHLDELENRLLAWKNWILPHFEQKTPKETVVALFEQYVADDLRAHGVDAKKLPSYESANPAFMSVVGLLRYWSQKPV